MTACATTATIFSFHNKQLDATHTTTVVLLWYGLSVPLLATGIASFTTASIARALAFVDVPCQDTYARPLLLLKATTPLYLFVIITFLVVYTRTMVFSDLKVKLGRPKIEGLTLVFVYGEALVMWLTLLSIISIRQGAKHIFGPSYQVRSSTSMS